MNRLVSRLLILVGLLLIVIGTANAQFCSESVLRGSYAFLIEGHTVVDPEAPPVPFMSTAISTFDYHGNEHSEGTINTPEGLLPSTADGRPAMQGCCCSGRWRSGRACYGALRRVSGITVGRIGSSTRWRSWSRSGCSGRRSATRISTITTRCVTMRCSRWRRGSGI